MIFPADLTGLIGAIGLVAIVLMALTSGRPRARRTRSRAAAEEAFRRQEQAFYEIVRLKEEISDLKHRGARAEAAWRATAPAGDDARLLALEVLGVDPDDAGNAQAVRSAWIAAVKTAHPDAGGSPGKLRSVMTAWRILGGRGN